LGQRIAVGTVKSGENGKNSSAKSPVTPVRPVNEGVVSALAQPLSGEELFRMYDQPRNTGFHTADGETGIPEKNTIAAVVHHGQTLIDGQSVRLRLSEPLIAGTALIPQNTLLTGAVKIQGERLEITVSSIEYQGSIFPVKMTAYDTDGQRGIYIPGSLELDAAKELLANMSGSVGTSFTMTQRTGAQVASDLTKGTIQGLSAYMQKKVRQVKVTLKAGHQVLLVCQ
jgi:conjugative transposon TraM protein